MGSQRYEYIRNIKRAYRRYIVSKAKMVGKEFNKAQNELEKEAKKMYDSYIRQYYRYKTQEYYRHVTGLGTRTGWNLYQAKDFVIETSNFNEYKNFYTLDVDHLSINFDTDQMMDSNYEDITKQEVFDLVMDGYRAYVGWSWSGKYKGKYFSYNGVMRDAFKEFDDQRINLLKKICSKNITIKKEKLKNKFIEVMASNIKELKKNGYIK